MDQPNKPPAQMIAPRGIDQPTQETHLTPPTPEERQRMLREDLVVLRDRLNTLLATEGDIPVLALAVGELDLRGQCMASFTGAIEGVVMGMGAMLRAMGKVLKSAQPDNPSVQSMDDLIVALSALGYISNHDTAKLAQRVGRTDAPINPQPSPYYVNTKEQGHG